MEYGRHNTNETEIRVRNILAHYHLTARAALRSYIYEKNSKTLFASFHKSATHNLIVVKMSKQLTIKKKSTYVYEFRNFINAR